MPVGEFPFHECFVTYKSQSNSFGVDDEGAINIELTREDLPSFAAVSYETLFKVTNEFLQHKLIGVKGRSFKLIDEKALLDMTINPN